MPIFFAESSDTLNGRPDKAWWHVQRSIHYGHLARRSIRARSSPPSLSPHHLRPRHAFRDPLLPATDPVPFSLAYALRLRFARQAS
eukprot:5745295-Pleurochrysis_carterae.AAC.1